MIWWAYAGFSGSIVMSLVMVAWTIGVPSNAIMQLAVATSSMLLGGAMLANLCTIVLRRPPAPALDGAATGAHLAGKRSDKKRSTLPPATMRTSSSLNRVASIASIKAADSDASKRTVVAPS